MLKFAALLLIFFCFALGGNAMANAERERIARGDGMILLIRSIRQGAAYFRQPLGEIFDSFSYPALEKSGFLKTLCERGLAEAFSAFQNEFGYDSFTEHRLSDFAAALGKLPLEEQLLSCDRILALLEEKAAEAKAAFPKKNKLYRTLGMTLGVGVVILLL